MHFPQIVSEYLPPGSTNKPWSQGWYAALSFTTLAFSEIRPCKMTIRKDQGMQYLRQRRKKKKDDTYEPGGF